MASMRASGRIGLAKCLSHPAIIAWASKGVPGSNILANPFAAAQLVAAASGLATEAAMHAAPPAQAGD
jgi:hypothetical protein